MESKIKVIKTDRNEVRYHMHGETVTVMYKSRQGLEHGWEVAKQLLKNTTIPTMPLAQQ